MAKDSILQLTAAGTLKVSTPDGSVSVRLDHVGLQIVAAMIRAILGDPTVKDLRLAAHAGYLPVEASPPAAKRAQRNVQVRVPR